MNAVRAAFFKGKLQLKADGAWVRVNFPTRLTLPLVLLGSPNYVGDFMLIPQVGTVDSNGFTVRVVVPSCVSADLTKRPIVVPYLALPETLRSDYLATTVLLTKNARARQFGTETHAYIYRAWNQVSADNVVFVQIQNMASIVDQARETSTTPYVFAVADGKMRKKTVYLALSAPLKTSHSFLSLAIVVLGSSAAAYFGNDQIELNSNFDLTSGEAIPHGLGSPVLAFIRPSGIDATFSYALEEIQDSTRFTPRVTLNCQQSGHTITQASYLLFASEEDDDGRLNSGPSCGAAKSTLSILKESCQEACSRLWSRYQSNYMACQNPMECFTQDFSTSATLQDALGQDFGLSLVKKLSKTCSFESVIFSFDGRKPNCLCTLQSNGNYILTCDCVAVFLGTCSCPDSGSACTLQEALWDMSWTNGLPRGVTALLSHKLRPRKRVARCASATLSGVLDGGVQCSRFSSSAIDNLEAVVCRDLCLDNWERYGDTAMASLSPYEAFRRLYDAWLTRNELKLPAALRKIASDCLFGECTVRRRVKRQGTFLLENGRYILREPCPGAYTIKIAGAKFGCDSAFSKEQETRSCRIQDVTETVKTACASLSTGSKNCTVEKSEISSLLQSCPSCQTFSLVVFYSCRMTAELLKDYDISVQRPSGEIIYSGDIPSCECSDGSSPATKAEATVLSSWQGSLSAPAQFLLGGARILSVDKDRSLSFSFWAPSSPADCQNDSFQVLCNFQSVLLCALSASLPAAPICEEAFSTRNTQSSFEDQLCKASCTHLLQGVCSSRSNQWACVHEHLTECYVPDSLRKTCAIRQASTEYNPRFKTCGCADDPTMEPCTVSEVEYLKFDWASSFKDTVEGKGGLLLLRNRKVMADTGLVYTDETIRQQKACADASKYQGIFCRVQSDSYNPELKFCGFADLEPKCRGAHSTEGSISDYQCAHSCVAEYTSCKKQTSTSAAACFAASQQGHPILSKCDVPLDLCSLTNSMCFAIAESNMIAGTVTITTDWERVTFPTQIAPDPVVFTGILHPLGTFGQVQITDVTESGFSIRLALDYCREGYAAAYAKVSWLAVSQRQYKVSESGAALRVSTTVVRVGKTTEFLPGVKLTSSAPILLTQIQDIPSDLSMEDIPFINVAHLDDTFARISLRSTAASPKQETFTVGFLYMDEVQGAECLTGCKLNNLAVEVSASATLDTERTSPIGYTEEYFSSRAPLIFGSMIFSQDDGGKRMLAEVPRASVTSATWTPKIFVVTNDTCEAFEFEEATAGTLPSRIASLLVQARMRPFPPATSSNFTIRPGASKTVDCTAECRKLATACAPSKAWECFVNAAETDLKRNCYGLSNQSIWQASCNAAPTTAEKLQTSATTPCVCSETVKCRVVDMTNYEYSDDIGWNVHAMSCFCPQGFDPCTPAQVEQDRAHWLTDVSLWGELCRSYDNVQPVAWGFMQVAYDICVVKTDLKWQKRPLPLYSFDDIFLKGYLNRSGYNQCAEETPFVFCPTASLTTATTTVAPTWDWPENAHCLPGSWEEWSDCSSTCTPSDPTQPLPVRKRQRAQLLPARGNGSACVLEEIVPCTFESPTPCNTLCRHSEWSQWSECTEKSLEFGVTPVTASSREKHVFAESGGACSEQKLREFDSSRCTGMESPSSGQTGTPSALEVDAEAFASPVAELWSEWSSCDAPCLSNGRPPQRYKLSLRTDVTGKQPVYEDTVTQDCPGAFDPCRRDRDPSCDDFLPQHDVPENQDFCRQSCKAILKSCEEEAKLSGTTTLQCLVTNIVNSQTLRGKCFLSPQLEKEAAAPTCFASFTRANDDESSEYPFLDPHSDAVQCLCLTANSVPCTAAEVFQSRQLSFESLSSFACPLQDEAGAIFDSETPGSADSKLYFAAADSSKISCPISSSKRHQQQAYKATYSTFASAAEMNEYCANGLPAQLKHSSSTPYDVGLDCERTTPKLSTVSPEDCKAKCLEIKQNCSESSANFLSCIATKRQTTEFDKECAAHAKVVAGKGLVFCKLIPRDCEYSEWGEWSECTSTCRRGPGAAANSIRIRSRQIVQPSSTGGEPCKFGSSSTDKGGGDGGTVETEVCVFQELCEDLDQQASLSFTPKPEPSLQPWSSDTTTTTSTEPTVDSTQQVTCNIVDMSSVQTDIGYDAGHRTCKCPHYTRPCSRAEAELSKSSWNQAMMTLCQKNGIATIPLSNFELFSCETRTFKDIHDFNELTAQDHCLTDQFASVLCVEADDVEAERRQIAITLLLMLTGGTIVGILLVLWFIQYSVDVQKALGLAGRYVELVNLAKE
ncbi:hypothetical protein Esti_002177 [Eimeria stiedai]